MTGQSTCTVASRSTGRLTPHNHSAHRQHLCSSSWSLRLCGCQTNSIMQMENTWVGEQICFTFALASPSPAMPFITASNSSRLKSSAQTLWAGLASLLALAPLVATSSSCVTGQLRLAFRLNSVHVLALLRMVTALRARVVPLLLIQLLVWLDRLTACGAGMNLPLLEVIAVWTPLCPLPLQPTTRGTRLPKLVSAAGGVTLGRAALLRLA